MVCGPGITLKDRCLGGRLRFLRVYMRDALRSSGRPGQKLCSPPRHFRLPPSSPPTLLRPYHAARHFAPDRRKRQDPLGAGVALASAAGNNVRMRPSFGLFYGRNNSAPGFGDRQHYRISRPASERLSGAFQPGFLVNWPFRRHRQRGESHRRSHPAATPRRSCRRLTLPG